MKLTPDAEHSKSPMITLIAQTQSDSYCFVYLKKCLNKTLYIFLYLFLIIYNIFF